MGDRAFDEAFAPDGFRILQGVQPGLISSTTFSKFASRKTSSKATDGLEFGMFFEGPGLEPKAVAVHPIVGVHPRDDGRPADGDPGAEAGDQSGVRS